MIFRIASTYPGGQRARRMDEKIDEIMEILRRDGPLTAPQIAARSRFIRTEVASACASKRAIGKIVWAQGGIYSAAPEGTDR